MAYKNRAIDYHNLVNRNTNCPSEMPHHLYFEILELVGEAGELANWVKKVWRGDRTLDDPEIAKEIADCYICLAVITSLLNLDEDEICNAKLEELENRALVKGYV